MILHKGEILFHQGHTGPLFHLKTGLLKIVRVHENGTQTLINIITPDEVIPHHSLLSAKEYHGTGIALVTCEVDPIPADGWYRSLERDPARCLTIAIKLQEKLRMMQQRIDQLTEVTPMNRLVKLQIWFDQYIAPVALTDILTQEEIGQFIGLRRETVNRLFREQAQSSKLQ